MSLLINSIYGMLGLTDDEQATVNAALPTIKDLLDAVDANLGAINQFEQLQIKNQPFIKTVVSDWAIIGPNLSAAISGGSVNLFAIANAFNDIKTQVAASSVAAQSATSLYNQLLPVINKGIADWPKIAPAVQVLAGAISRSKMTVDTLLTAVSKSG